MTAKPGIIYLQKDKFQLFSPFLRQIVEFRFVPEIIRDSDVVNPEMLESLIKAFVANTKVPPGNLTIILADNAYFVKDFVLPPPPKGQPQAQQPQMTMETLHVLSMDFIEHVPYENVVSKSIPLKNGIRVCAVNKDFFDVIKNSFTKLGFVVDGVYPGFILGNNLSAKPVLDNALVSAYFQKASSIKQFDLLQEEIYKPAPRKGIETSAEADEADEVAANEKNKKPDKKRLYFMIGFFVFLLIILVVVYMQSLTPPPATQDPSVQSAQPGAPANTNTAPIATTVPTVATATTAPTIKASDIAVQITNASPTDTSAQTLREALSKFSFKTLTVSSQSSATTTSTVVSFSGSVNQSVRNAVLEEIRKVKTNVTVQERQEGEYDITIVLAN